MHKSRRNQDHEFEGTARALHDLNIYDTDYTVQCIGLTAARQTHL